MSLLSSQVPGLSGVVCECVNCIDSLELVLCHWCVIHILLVLVSAHVCIFEFLYAIPASRVHCCGLMSVCTHGVHICHLVSMCIQLGSHEPFNLYHYAFSDALDQVHVPSSPTCDQESMDS